MKKYSINGIHIKLLLDTRRIKDDLTYPVKYRITHKRIHWYISTGISLSEKLWDDVNNCNDRDSTELNVLLKFGLNNIIQETNNLLINNEFSFKKLKLRIQNKGLFALDFKDEFKEIIKQFPTDLIMNEIKSRIKN